MSCSSCQMKKHSGHKDGGGEQFEAHVRRLAHKAGMQHRASSAPAGHAEASAAPAAHAELVPPPERQTRVIAHIDDKQPLEPVRVDPKRPGIPGDAGPQGWDIKHTHATSNLWHEPVTWLAGALALSAVAGLVSTIIYVKAKG